jgi:hypothetical protein
MQPHFTMPYAQSNIASSEEQTVALLSCLWRGGNYAYWWTPDGPEYFSKKYQEWRIAKVSLWFPLNQRWPAVPAAWHAKQVYFGVHPTISYGQHWHRARIDTVASVNSVFAEFDVEDYGSKFAIWNHLETLPVFPTCIIDSGGGLHAYWWLEHPVAITNENRAYMKRCQAAWVDLTGGDDGAKDLARVLRLPGWQNRKPERGPDFPTVKIMELNPRRLFSFSRIQALVDDRIAEDEAAERQRIELERARSNEVASGAAETLLDWAVRNAHTGSRHSMALWLAGRLKAEGLAQWVASSVLKEFARQVSAAGTRQIDAGEMDKIVNYVWSTQ